MMGMDGETLTERSHGYWSGRAPEYSELHEREMASPRGEAFRRWVASLPSTGAGVRALDLGCGSGFVTVCLALAGCSVTAVDFSEQMLEQARANARAHGAVGVEFRQMDVHDLAFDAETFDLVMTRNVTWVLEDLASVYAEVLRVLRPGGTFVNVDADYGRQILARMEAGIEPQHPTQTLEQLHERDAIVAGLPQSRLGRPAWDLAELRRLGFSTVGCEPDLDRVLLAQMTTMEDITNSQDVPGVPAAPVELGGFDAPAVHDASAVPAAPTAPDASGGSDVTGTRDALAAPVVPCASSAPAEPPSVRAEANTQDGLFAITAVK